MFDPETSLKMAHQRYQECMFCGRLTPVPPDPPAASPSAPEGEAPPSAPAAQEGQQQPSGNRVQQRLERMRYGWIPIGQIS